MSTIIGTVTITKNPAYGRAWWPRRLNQQSQETADGGLVCYDNGPEIIEGELVINLIDKAQGDALRTYLQGTAYMGYASFTITPPANTDLGNGAGVAITVNYTGGPSLEGVLEPVPPGLYNLRLPYRKVVT